MPALGGTGGAPRPNWTKELSAAASCRSLIAPLARALALLAAFAPEDCWLGAGDLIARTGIPSSTVTRIAGSLVQLGYLQYGRTERKYRLTAKVLALGYGAVATNDVQRIARTLMAAFTEQHGLQMVSLSTRDRLGIVVLETFGSKQAPMFAGMNAGTRMSIGASPLGWALLAALPQPERRYLLDNVERRMAQDWIRVRRRASAAIAQVQEQGYCLVVDEGRPNAAIVATPLMVPGRSPLVLACGGSSTQLARACVEREIGPRLLTLAAAIQEAGGAT